MSDTLHDDLNPYMPLYIDNSGEPLPSTEGVFDETFEESGGGTTEAKWGSISGTITDQTDLIDYVDDISGMVEVKELEEKVDVIDTNVTALNTTVTTLGSDKLDKTEYTQGQEQTAGSLETFNVRLNDLQTQLEDSKKFNVEAIVLYDGSDTEYENKEKDFTVKGNITNHTNVKGNSVTLDDVKISTASVGLKTAEDITIKNVEVTGLIPQKYSNALFLLHADGYITMRDCLINPESAYNGIEVGYVSGLAKSILIDNVDFEGQFLNNAIEVAGMAENSVITISNCHFKDVANVLKLSNRTNSTCMINIINCTVDKWNTELQYGGLISLQDITSTSIEEAEAADLFSKLTINIQNVTGPHGKITMPADLSTICGSKDENQVIYMWNEWINHVPYSPKYPTINIL